jgi:hypothetical protein
MTEREMIEQIQKDKASMVENLKALTKIQKDRGDRKAQNAVFLTLAQLDVWHGKATKRLFKHFPEFADEIVARGPGR